MRSRVVAIFAIVSIPVLLIGLLGILWSGHSRVDDRQDERTAFIQAARQAVLNLTTISADSVESDVERLRASTTGAFLDDFDTRVDAFTSVVKQSSVTTTGEIIAVGIESIDGDVARLLVRAQSKVTNASGAESEDRNWRLRVTMSRSENRILMSGVDFVA
ncbi:mammalian cell entry protein [Rhodococcus erythropolis]|uniref:mammalian cell entry protein n=1 Tax=Rhodococcus erythropolis TaxID=1833 RepID=UPI001E32900F|nr:MULTISPECIES: mammalian cell entry protein [Rhodococcus erythropolis group]MCD2107918.1 mammalian cell entry protein [Rhodococcus qingshengii]MCZ4527089.1 mammalian cell entry protein [Rhodococcus erythropolis]